MTVEVTCNGLEYSNSRSEFLYVRDASVVAVKPERGLATGQYPVFVMGSNFVNTTALGCRFDRVAVRATFISSRVLSCPAPSRTAGTLEIMSTAHVEVTNNGMDYTDSRVAFEYYTECDDGYYCPGLTPSLCPNGTVCTHAGGFNFTRCFPGTFQPRAGQRACVDCPVGYICPDHGMVKPVLCPAGYVCDVRGLRTPLNSCPEGHYCLPGTKTASVTAFQQADDALWLRDYETGVVSYNRTARGWPFYDRSLPATGTGRAEYPPDLHPCVGRRCARGSVDLIAEQPFPCPLGHYCGTAVATDVPVPKNFSTPQRCFDGYFCPRGSTTPEGTGPCPTGFYCPSQTVAVTCPTGEYCPGVGNVKPLECYPGTYNPLQQQSNCTLCPTGHICPGWGRTEPEPCPPGFICISLGLSAPVVLCPAGFYCPEGTLTLDPSDPTDLRPMPCAPGTFCLGGVAHDMTVEWIPQNADGRTAPQTCTEGAFCGAASPSAAGSGACFPGHYCPMGGEYPTEVPLGSFSGTGGAVVATLCFPGSYAPLTGTVDCRMCPAGYSCEGYGTYEPKICPAGKYRSSADSVTCRFCPTGTFSPYKGSSDITQCLPCPPGRVCGVQGMVTLEKSLPCPEGYTCGVGTNRGMMFEHKCPAGFYCGQETLPVQQYGYSCSAGHYCTRGTPAYLSTRNKCNVGYFCPAGTASGTEPQTRCPRQTTTATGADQLIDCAIKETDVCDKMEVNPQNPFEDMSYYIEHSYTLIDGSEKLVEFDSAASSGGTGEVEVLNKVNPVNLSASIDLWTNDTVESFRTCPEYAPAQGGDDSVVLIGRNFQPNDLLTCRWTACLGNGNHPRRCRDPYRDGAGYFQDDRGNYDKDSKFKIEMPGEYLSPTRVRCPNPGYTFEPNITESKVCVVSGLTGEDRVGYVDPTADAEVDHPAGTCDYDGTNLAQALGNPLRHGGGGGFLGVCVQFDLIIPCTQHEIYHGRCPKVPDPAFNTKWNPCYTGEVKVDVANNGLAFSGDGNVMNHTSLYDIDEAGNHPDFIVPPTWAVFTFVQNDYFLNNSAVYAMDTGRCNRTKYREEGLRTREEGWFSLQGMELAQLQLDWRHLPSDMTYDEHYKLAIYVRPSRCTEELCNADRIRLTAAEVTMDSRSPNPCSRPMDLPPWFTDPAVNKNDLLNMTIFALDDIIFKVEVHIVHGLFIPAAPQFVNTTSISLKRPERALVEQANAPWISKLPLRRLSPHISYEERLVRQSWFFGIVYRKETATVDGISYPLNMPPLLKEYEKGRALLMFNVSHRADQPVHYSGKEVPPGWWDNPHPKVQFTKQDVDMYFETFHGILPDPEIQANLDKFADTNCANDLEGPTCDPAKNVSVSTEQYAGVKAFGPVDAPVDFNSMVLPYLPYFSNCHGFDKYIPFHHLVEDSMECGAGLDELETAYDAGNDADVDFDVMWPDRKKHGPFPDLDNTYAVGPFQMAVQDTQWDQSTGWQRETKALKHQKRWDSPVADWCERTVQCNYEEDLTSSSGASSPWYLSGGGETLFEMMETPITFLQYTGRETTRPQPKDMAAIHGVVDDLLRVAGPDGFIGAEVDAEAMVDAEDSGACDGDNPCIPRDITLSVDYYERGYSPAKELDEQGKKLVRITVIFDGYDSDVENTAYSLNVSFRPLNYVELIVAFAFEAGVFVVLFLLIAIFSIVLAAALYIVMRTTTLLENPPQLKILGMFMLIAPQPTAGIMLGLVPVLVVMSMFYALIKNRGMWAAFGASDIPSDVLMNAIDSTKLHWMDAKFLPEDVVKARNGRMGLAFCALSAMCLVAGAHIFLPERDSKREREMELKREKAAAKESIWAPLMWKRSNLIATSYAVGCFSIIIVEFSFWSDFGTYIYQFIILASNIMGIFVGKTIDSQLGETLLANPIGTALGVAFGIVTLSADDFKDFLLGYFVEFLMMMAMRIYIDPGLSAFEEWVGETSVWLVEYLKKKMPKWLVGRMTAQEAAAVKNEDEQKRDLEGIVTEGAETVEPLLDSFGS